MLSTHWRTSLCSTWNTALVELWSNWRLWTAALITGALWSAFVAAQEPGFLRTQGLQIGWDGLHWALALAGTLASAFAMPELSERLRVAIRRSRRPFSALVGIQLAWAASLTGLWMASFLVLGLVGRLRGLPWPADTTDRLLASWVSLLSWALLVPGLAAWLGRLTQALSAWLALWVSGLLLDLPLPLGALHSNFSSLTALFSVITAYALTVASIEFRVRSDRRPR